MNHPRIFTLNEPNAPRLNPALACEIGLNESLLLLQLEFWISISNNERDGKQWTYQSTRDIKNKAFPFWSVMTINRGIKSLIKQGLIISTTEYNQVRYDKTRWFSLVPENINKLSSIRIDGYVTRSSQFDTRSGQNDTALIYTETSTEISTNNNSSGCCCSSNDNPKQPPTIPHDPEPSRGLQESKDSNNDIRNNDDLQELLSLIPVSLHSPALIQLILAALQAHTKLFVYEACLYTLKHSNQGISQFVSFLGLTIKNNWHIGFIDQQDQNKKEQNQTDKNKQLAFLESRREMPSEHLKIDAENGCKISAQVLRERSKHNEK